MLKSAISFLQQGELAERRLWRAVIAKSLEEWICGPLTFSRKAEEFLFQDKKDFGHKKAVLNTTAHWAPKAYGV
jgi:hypothetical protein